MNEDFKNRKKVLIASFTKFDVVDSLPLLKKFEEHGSAVTSLGIDFSSWIEFRRRNIPFETPEDYFDKTKCSKIDSEALLLAKCWFKPFEDKITYHGICIGEMAEYNFMFLFMDALRSIEIATSLIDVGNPDEVWLPENIPVGDPSAVRYESLSMAINAVAKSRGIPVSYNNSNSSFRISNEESLFRNIASNTLNQIRKIDLRSKSCTNRNKIAFIDVPAEILFSVKRQLEREQRYFVVDLSAPTLVNRGKILGNYSAQNMALCRELKNPEFARNLIYRGVSLVEILAERFSQFFSNNLPGLINCIDGTEKFITNARPQLVVTMCDTPPIYRTIIKVCKINCIPTLVIQHGVTAGDMNGFHVMPIEADKQAVWGIISKEWAIQRGKPPETQVITGNPRYDSIVTMKSKEKNQLKVYDQLGLNRQKGIVVIATSWYAGVSSCYTPEDVEDFISKTLEAMKDFPEKQVVVKLHPGYYETYKEITLEISNELKMDNVFITRHFLWELLDICDLLITHSSTVGLEAMLFNKPVVTFYSKEISSLVPYANTASVIKVHEASELVSAIRNALYNKKLQMALEEARRRFIYEYTYTQDGKSSQRVADLIESMIKENSVKSIDTSCRLKFHN
jgi:CDP-Glycerol:Poly(glycerophosphate) glycerophosphotransferase